MKTKFKGILYYSKNIKDNDLYVKILSSNDEVNSGIVYGGNSSKKRSIYQNGYFIECTMSKKNQNSPPVFSGEITEPFLINIFNDKYKMHALLSITSLINLSIVEGQHVKGIFEDIENIIYTIITQNHWIKSYCEWLFNLLQKIGYQIDYKKNKNKKYFDISKKEFYYEYSDGSIVFPHFFFTKLEDVSYKNLNIIFEIFESIFLKNHLDNINYKMPLNYLNFKKLILNELN